MASKGRKSLNEGKLVNLEDVKKIFREMFKAHEKSIVDILAANNKIMNDRLDKITKTIEDLQESLEFTENDLNSKVLKVETFMLNESGLVREKIRDLEDRSRRNNLRIDGVKESERESCEDTEVKMQNLFTNELGLQRQINIERAHRT